MQLTKSTVPSELLPVLLVPSFALDPCAMVMLAPLATAEAKRPAGVLTPDPFISSVPIPRANCFAKTISSRSPTLKFMSCRISRSISTSFVRCVQADSCRRPKAATADCADCTVSPTWLELDDTSSTMGYWVVTPFSVSMMLEAQPLKMSLLLLLHGEERVVHPGAREPASGLRVGYRLRALYVLPVLRVGGDVRLAVLASGPEAAPLLAVVLAEASAGGVGQPRQARVLPQAVGRQAADLLEVHLPLRGRDYRDGRRLPLAVAAGQAGFAHEVFERGHRLAVCVVGAVGNPYHGVTSLLVCFAPTVPRRDGCYRPRTKEMKSRRLGQPQRLTPQRSR